MKVPSSMEEWSDLTDADVDELVNALQSVGVAGLDTEDQTKLGSFVADILVQMSKVRMMLSFLT